MIIDTHAHLNADEFKEDFEEVLSRAKANDVQLILVIGTDEESNKIAIQQAETHEMVYATVGVHPGSCESSTTNHLKALTLNKKVVAIGECGLDLYWKKENIELQKKVFIEQIELAKKTKLPLIIHTRNSFEEAYQCLLPYQKEVKGVFHCFSSGVIDAKRAIDLGFYIGIDGPITYKKSTDLIEIVQQIDLKHILVETDSPYMTPTPYRGKRNEPGYVHLVVEKIAEIKGLTIEEVKRQTTQNAFDLFHLGGFKK
jgi:TatD DNase family protein